MGICMKVILINHDRTAICDEKMGQFCNGKFPTIKIRRSVRSIFIFKVLDQYPLMSLRNFLDSSPLFIDLIFSSMKCLT